MFNRFTKEKMVLLEIKSTWTTGRLILLKSHSNCVFLILCILLSLLQF